MNTVHVAALLKSHVVLVTGCHAMLVLQTTMRSSVDLDLVLHIVGQEDPRLLAQLVREAGVSLREAQVNAIDVEVTVVVSVIVAKGNAIEVGGHCHTSVCRDSHDHHNPYDLFETHLHFPIALTLCPQWLMLGPYRPCGHLYDHLYGPLYLAGHGRGTCPHALPFVLTESTSCCLDSGYVSSIWLC